MNSEGPTKRNLTDQEILSSIALSLEAIARHPNLTFKEEDLDDLIEWSRDLRRISCNISKLEGYVNQLSKQTVNSSYVG